MSITEEENVRLIPVPDYETWLKMGIQKGYCSDQYCSNHVYHAPEDREIFHKLLEEYEARDFCWPVVRLRTLPEDD
jgi:hypothetical protein|tara:strand:- start:115 stop:342 length:228 start_codon:yes stop_codon:yes gene_type:complete